MVVPDNIMPRYLSIRVGHLDIPVIAYCPFLLPLRGEL
jgi:hypothetical protein